MNKPDPIIDKQLEDERISHGFFTRHGGVSTGIFSGLNVGLGSDDDPGNVLENRKRVAQHFGATPENLMTAYQIHSPNVLQVSDQWQNEQRPQLDALVTATPGLVIGVLSADCGPVLFSDPQNKVIGAAHAGWKGATGGVLENTLAEMEKLGANRQSITAVLGPTISVKNYEVGPEFVENLIKLNSQNDRYLKASAKPDHAMFDLPNYIIDRLKAAGVNAKWTGHCTYGNEDLLYSYRRKTHRNEPDYGRQISAISIRE